MGTSYQQLPKHCCSCLFIFPSGSVICSSVFCHFQNFHDPSSWDVHPQILTPCSIGTPVATCHSRLRQDTMVGCLLDRTHIPISHLVHWLSFLRWTLVRKWYLLATVQSNSKSKKMFWCFGTYILKDNEMTADNWHSKQGQCFHRLLLDTSQEQSQCVSKFLQISYKTSTLYHGWWVHSSLFPAPLITVLPLKVWSPVWFAGTIPILQVPMALQQCPAVTQVMTESEHGVQVW